MPVVHCPTCRQALSVADGLGGAVVTCPACRQPMTLPAAFPVAAPDPPPAPAGRGRKTDRTPVVLVGAAGFLGLVGVGVVVWMLAGSSKATPTAKDKPEAAKAAPAAKGKAEPADPAGRIDAVIARVKKATVYIRLTGKKGVASGSGFFVDKSMVVTNHHVIDHPGKLEVVVESGTTRVRTYPARVVGSDPGKDLALLEVVGANVPDPLTVIDTTGLRETHDVYAFGFPLGERLGDEISVNRAAVSSLRRGPRGQEIQMNGGLIPGNSGGPVTDPTGRVVGVVVSMVAGTPINFAIAGEEVLTFLARFHDR